VLQISEVWDFGIFAQLPEEHPNIKIHNAPKSENF
jgi:hypothetical protein